MMNNIKSGIYLIKNKINKYTRKTLAEEYKISAAALDKIIGNQTWKEQTNPPFDQKSN